MYISLPGASETARTVHQHVSATLTPLFKFKKMALVVVDKSKSPVDIEAKPGIVGNKYYVDKRIGEGSFGVIYKGMRVIVLLQVFFNLCDSISILKVSSVEEITESPSNL